MRVNESGVGPGRRAVWAAGLLVAAGAGVATAHGLYQVAAAAHVPSAIGWLYPLITDGLALVAYAATSRLATGARRYAWVIVVLAASLSGLAQAVYLAGGIDAHAVAPVGLRFGVGAWPAAAAALTAHLLHLIGARPTTSTEATSPADVQPSTAPSVRPFNLYGSSSAVQPQRSTVAGQPPAVQPPAPVTVERTQQAGSNVRRSESGAGAESASGRARHAARSYYARHGDLPTATELMAAAQVSRGTAGTVLKDLRDNRPDLHIVHAEPSKDASQ